MRRCRHHHLDTIRILVPELWHILSVVGYAVGAATFATFVVLAPFAFGTAEMEGWRLWPFSSARPSGSSGGSASHQTI